MSEVLPWHDAAWQRLAAARSGGRLAHALLLTGPPGLGKGAFARRLAHALVCVAPASSGDACGACAACHQAAAGSHPDQLWVVPDEPGRPIRIDAIRRLGARVVLAAQPEGHRVTVIEPAEAMNRAAANALLKTLEEPVPRHVLILVSSAPHRLLPTIRSRCQRVAFRPPAAAAAWAWLGDHLDGAEPDALLAVAGGAPLLALTAQRDDWLGEGARLGEALGALKARRINPLAVVEEWQKRPLTQVIAGLKRCVCDLARLAAVPSTTRLFHGGLRDELQSLGQGLDWRSLHRFSDQLTEAERAMDNNLNGQMVLEGLVNRWLEITRPGVR